MRRFCRGGDGVVGPEVPPAGIENTGERRRRQLGRVRRFRSSKKQRNVKFEDSSYDRNVLLSPTGFRTNLV